MTRTTTEPKSTEGYSLPIWMHDRIREEADAADSSRSAIVRQAMRMYLNYLESHRLANRSAS